MINDSVRENPQKAVIRNSDHRLYLPAITILNNLFLGLDYTFRTAQWIIKPQKGIFDENQHIKPCQAYAYIFPPFLEIAARIHAPKQKTIPPASKLKAKGASPVCGIFITLRSDTNEFARSMPFSDIHASNGRSAMPWAIRSFT
jgi:hypothetical protein